MAVEAAKASALPGIRYLGTSVCQEQAHIALFDTPKNPEN